MGISEYTAKLGERVTSLEKDFGTLSNQINQLLTSQKREISELQNKVIRLENKKTIDK